jgi:heme oxygenase
LPSFSPDSGTALGAAWVLAGSALGNRAIAKAVTRIGGGSWPAAFLGDGAMMAFWQGLRARIERPASPKEAEGAAEAAAAVFAHFLRVAEQAEPAPQSVPA